MTYAIPSLAIKHLVFILTTLSVLLLIPGTAKAVEESGSVGIQGKVSAPPPTQAATITFPTNGSVVTNLPVNVSGICPKGLLVKIFKNNVFGGSVQCTTGSFSIQIDLFSGQNELVARVYDDLDQAGPDSNIVTVTHPFNQFNASSRPSLTSSFAKRGANPNQTLTWPITVSGGTGPYAISIDWGDGKPPQLISVEFAGVFNGTHVYDVPGVYNVIVRATDKNGEVAFLQLVAVANGPLSQTNQNTGGGSGSLDTTVKKTRILWYPVLITIPFIVTAFWLGRKHELHMLRRQLEQRGK